MNAQEIDILLEYWKEKGNQEQVKHYQYKLEQYEKDQNRD